MLEIVLATNNPKKRLELEALLAGLPVRIVPPSELRNPPRPVEDGDTFEANALRKAVAFCEATGRLALADDSGLEVDALGGRPGVHSSRYAGEDGDDEANNRKLLAELEGVPDEKRTARFRCVLCLRGPQGSAETVEIFCDGRVEGRITRAPRGEGGFGYDPLFEIPSEGRTFAELGADYKNRHSHRARALAGMKEEIRALLERSASPNR